MSIHKYKTFTKTVELGSLTKAAEELGYTQSAISHTINSLEKQFGFPLLIRNKSGIIPTENGKRVIQHMYEVLNRDKALHQIVSSINGLQSGTISIGTFCSVATQWLPGMIQEFETLYPAIEIEILDGVYQEVESWIYSEKVECGFVTFHIHKDIKCIPLIKDPLLAVLPADHPMCDEKYFPLELFNTEPFIMPGEGAHYDIGRVFAKAGITPNIRFSFRDDYSAIAMVEKGLGITILPELVIQGNPRNIKIMVLESHEYRTISIATSSAKYISPAVKRFLKHVQNWVTRHLPRENCLVAR